MSITKIVTEVKSFFEQVLGKEAHVIGVERSDNGWHVQVETVEESQYMRARALDDIVGLYEVRIDDNLEIVSYERIALRERAVIDGDDEDNE